MNFSAYQQWIIQSIAYLFRFRSLQFAEFVYGTSEGQQHLERRVNVRLFGLTLPLRVSRSVTHRLLCVEGERFIQERDLLRSLVKNGDVIIDVGANVGYLSLLFLQSVGPTGKLVCVEPDSDNFEELSHCMQVNKRADVVLIQAAVGDAPGVVHLSPGLNGHISDKGSIDVPQMTVDSLASHRPNFIKIDVEGYEERVIDGAMNTFREYCPTVFVELHPYLVPNRTDIRSILEKLDSVYDQIDFMEYRVPSRLLPKLLMRYNLMSGVTSITDRNKLLDLIETYNRDQPFWAICHQKKQR